jgi:ElaB/YqjD/DUF883 family membrane-anchored ribosome-binding protein
MAREPNSPALAADYDQLVAQLSVANSATQNGRALADSATATLHDVRRYAGRQAHVADANMQRSVAENPYIALGLAAGLGLLLGALTRR